jgi:Zn-dependent protease with chaperone function
MKHVENIRYAQEQLIADRLLSSIQVSSFLHARKMKALEEGRNNNRLTDRLRKQFVELNPILTPRIYEVYSLVAESLGLGSEVTIFCSNENQINASVTIEPTLTEEDKDSYIMVITSQALERLTENELRYLIGHELGHILFSHHKILPIGDLVKTGKDSDEDQPSTGLPILTERDYLQWKIMSEISCDSG